MARLSEDQWQTLRAEYEVGDSLNAVAARHGVSRAGIQKRAKAEGWTQDVAPLIRAKVAEKVAGIVAGGNSQKKAQAIDAAADRGADVLRRHQEEPQQIREMLYGAVVAHGKAQSRDEKVLAFEDLKAAKISSEVMMNIHKMERQAHMLDEVAPAIDVTKLSDAQLEAMAKSKR